MTGDRFSVKEDVLLWRFAVDNPSESTGYSMWKKFKQERQTERSATAIYMHFHRVLLPNLPNTKFHTETKLKWCKQYNLVVGSDFLEELEKDAEIQLNARGMVTDWKLKPSCPENRDLKLSDEEFLELTRRERNYFTAKEYKIMTYDRFSAEEDVFLWKFAIGSPSECTVNMWKKFKQERQSERSVSALYNRFHRLLLSHLPNSCFHPQTKLQLCKSHKIPVDKEFSKKLQIHADIKLDANNRVINFTMNSNVPENKDAEMDYDELLEAIPLVSPTLSKFSDEEDDAIWRFVTVEMENHSGPIPWVVLKKQLKSERDPFMFDQRFFCNLAPTLHFADFDVKTKLKLYKKYQIPVDKDYVDILKRYADLEIDKNRLIQSYQMIGINEDDTLSEPEQDDEKKENQEKNKEEESDEFEAGTWEELDLHQDLEYKPEPVFIEDADVENSNLPKSIGEIKQEYTQTLTSLDDTKLVDIERRIRNAMQNNYENGEATDRVDLIYSILNMGLRTIIGSMNSKSSLSLAETQWSHETVKENNRKVSDDICPKITEEVTPEEELKIWNYILEKPNCETGSRLFWRDYLKGTIWKSHPSAFMERFEQYIVPNLHKTDLDLKFKLALYKKCQNTVSKPFLKTIPEDVSVKLDQNGCLSWYKLPTKKPKLKKRWSSPEYKPDIKRYKPEIKERSDKNVDKPTVQAEREEDEDLVVGKTVPGTGVPNPDKIIIIPPKVEIDDSEHEQPFDNYEAAGLLQPKEEIIEEDVDWNQSYQISPELSAMIAGYVNLANVPLKNQIAHLSESLFSLEKNVLEMRRNMSSENSEEADKEQFFINFKNWISAQKSSKMEEIDRRVESAIRASNELPEDVIYSIFDNGLKMIGS